LDLKNKWVVSRGAVDDAGGVERGGEGSGSASGSGKEGRKMGSISRGKVVGSTK